MLVTPFCPNVGTSLPVLASSANRRWSVFRKTRISDPLRQTATPRCFMPVLSSSPFQVSGSNDHSSFPVSASSATARLYAVLRYSTLSIMTGVFSNGPGREPYSDLGTSAVLHSHARSSRLTLAGVMSGSVEYFMLAASPPQYGHSTRRESPRCAPSCTTANATTATAQSFFTLHLLVAAVLDGGLRWTEGRARAAIVGQENEADNLGACQRMVRKCSTIRPISSSVSSRVDIGGICPIPS